MHIWYATGDEAHAVTVARGNNRLDFIDVAGYGGLQSDTDIVTLNSTSSHHAYGNSQVDQTFSRSLSPKDIPAERVAFPKGNEIRVFSLRDMFKVK